jgi:hypothetical protein
MSKTFDFEKERRAANANIREMKVTEPFIFHEWHMVQIATDKLREAHLELELALKKWDDLGKDDD